MSKILLFSDLHCHMHKKSESRLTDCLKALEWVFERAEAHGMEDIVFAGDLFQDRQKIDVLTYHLTFNVIHKYCSEANRRLWLLLGNHDLWYHDRWDVSSVGPLSAVPGVKVIDKPCTIKIAGVPIDFLPYTHQPIEHLNQLREQAQKRKGRKTLVAHLAVHGAQLNTVFNTRSDVVIEHDGEMVPVDVTQFEGWDQVWLGHYHGHQKVSPTVEYIGSTLQLSFGEAFQHKYAIINDLETGDKEYLKNEISPQHLIIPESDTDKYDIQNNFIRLTVSDMASSDVLQVRRNLQGLNPGSLEVMPEEKEDTTHIIEDAKAILYKEDEMLEQYVKQQADLGGLEAKLLVDLGKAICKAPMEVS